MSNSALQVLTDKLEALIGRYDFHGDRVRTSNPTVPADDIRLALYGMTANVLTTHLLALRMMDDCLLNHEWWNNNVKRVRNPAARQYQVDQSITHWKMGTFILFFSYYEAILRQILRSVRPGACNNGLSAFENVYASLLAYLNLKRHMATLHFARMIRNLLHNNGTYFNKNGKREAVVFLGQTYVFEHGHEVKFGYLEVLFAIYDGLLDLANDLNAHPEVIKLPYRRMH